MPFEAYLYIRVYIYVYIYAHTLSHMHIHIYIDRFGGSLRFLPVSQSEGPTKFPDVLYVGGDGSWPYSIWLILKDHLRIPQGICVQRQKRARLGPPMGPWTR